MSDIYDEIYALLKPFCGCINFDPEVVGSIRPVVTVGRFYAYIDFSDGEVVEFSTDSPRAFWKFAYSLYREYHV